MKSIRTALLLSLATSAILATASFQGHTLKFSGKAGDVSTYRLTGEFEAQGMTVGLSALLKSKIVSVDANGDYTVEEEQSSMVITFGGQEMPMPPSPPTRSKMKANGEVISITGDDSGEDTYRAAALTSFYYPSKAINVGDSWTFEGKGDDKLGIKPFTATYKFEAVETVGKYETAKISYTVKETGGSIPATAKGLIWLDTKASDMIKLESAWENFPTPGAPEPITGKIKVEKVD